ncbi:molybdate ABC transporter substrate-binding protein [Vibrio maerlii]|uniref:molybdate ABC transporter substrate-binding protein n=1 Tax=Vibrio maerlii TaxID=2231648 RepID=UPI000E3CEA48|nr:molybdate ABC transporter substrate-binding protein [Vibrio maerlii]
MRSLKKLFKHSILFTSVLCVSHFVHADTLRVYAASSMTNVMDEIATVYKQESDVEITNVFGSSSSLARQISFGAPADIYISANEHWMDYLVDEEIIARERVTPLVGNELVVIASKSEHKPDSINLSSVQAWQDALKGNRLAIGEPSSVPAGMYAKQALSNLGIWPSIQSQLAPTKNVRMALALVARGEVPLGIVYATDAKQEDGVQTYATLSQNDYDRIEYPIAAVTLSSNTQDFIEFLTSERAQSIFQSYGFSTINPMKKLIPNKTTHSDKAIN